MLRNLYVPYRLHYSPCAQFCMQWNQSETSSYFSKILCIIIICLVSKLGLCRRAACPTYHVFLDSIILMIFSEDKQFNLNWKSGLRRRAACPTYHVFPDSIILTFQSLLLTLCTNSLTFNNCMFCAHCIYVFCIYLRTNSDLCHLQHKLTGFYNRDEKCLLRGTNWVFK